MTAAEYIAFVRRQSTHGDKARAGRLGLWSEAGEVAGLFERELRAGCQPIDRDKLVEELGDCLFYFVLWSSSEGTGRWAMDYLGERWAKLPLIARTDWRKWGTSHDRLFSSDRRNVLYSLLAIFGRLGMTAQDVAACNVAKLERRNAEGSITDRSKRTA